MPNYSCLEVCCQSINLKMAIRAETRSWYLCNKQHTSNHQVFVFYSWLIQLYTAARRVCDGCHNNSGYWNPWDSSIVITVPMPRYTEVYWNSGSYVQTVRQLLSFDWWNTSALDWDTLIVLCDSAWASLYVSPLKTKRILLYIRIQSVPRCKHFPPRL